jgi:hypothetical protein
MNKNHKIENLCSITIKDVDNDLFPHLTEDQKLEISHKMTTLFKEEYNKIHPESFMTS